MSAEFGVINSNLSVGMNADDVFDFLDGSKIRYMEIGDDFITVEPGDEYKMMKESMGLKQDRWLIIQLTKGQGKTYRTVEIITIELRDNTVLNIRCDIEMIAL